MAFAAGATITTYGKSVEAKRMVSNTQVVPSYMGFGTGATAAARTAAVGDVALSTPALSSGTTARIAFTPTNTTTTNTGDTASSVATFVSSGANSIDEIGVFDAATGSNMCYSITVVPYVLANTDTITYTVNVQYS